MIIKYIFKKIQINVCNKATNFHLTVSCNSFFGLKVTRTFFYPETIFYSVYFFPATFSFKEDKKKELILRKIEALFVRANCKTTDPTKNLCKAKLRYTDGLLTTIWRGKNTSFLLMSFFS